MKVAIIGYGFVGKAIENALHDSVELYLVDPILKTKIVELSNFKPEIIFVCVPTPMTQDGNFDLSMVKDVAGRFIQGKLLVIKSTITPSAAEELVNKYPMHTFVFPNLRLPDFLSTQH